MKFVWKDGFIDHMQLNVDPLPRYWRRYKQSRSDFTWPPLFDDKLIDQESLSVVTFELKEHEESYVDMWHFIQLGKYLQYEEI